MASQAFHIDLVTFYLSSNNRSDRAKEPVYQLLPLGVEVAERLKGDAVLFRDLDELPAAKHLDDALYTTDDGSDGVVMFVDHRELGGDNHKLITLNNLLSRYSIKFKTTSLPVGDYSWFYRENGNEKVLPILVERKRGDDLAESIKDGRFVRQRENMKKWKQDFGVLAYLVQLIYIIESDVQTYVVHCGHECVGRCGNPDLLQVMGALGEIENDRDFNVIETKQVENTAECLANITLELTTRIGSGDFEILLHPHGTFTSNSCRKRKFYALGTSDLNKNTQMSHVIPKKKQANKKTINPSTSSASLPCLPSLATSVCYDDDSEIRKIIDNTRTFTDDNNFKTSNKTRVKRVAHTTHKFNKISLNERSEECSLCYTNMSHKLIDTEDCSNARDKTSTLDISVDNHVKPLSSNEIDDRTDYKELTLHEPNMYCSKNKSHQTVWHLSADVSELHEDKKQLSSRTNNDEIDSPVSVNNSDGGTGYAYFTRDQQLYDDDDSQSQSQEILNFKDLVRRYAKYDDCQESQDYHDGRNPEEISQTSEVDLVGKPKIVTPQNFKTRTRPKANTNFSEFLLSEDDAQYPGTSTNRFPDDDSGFESGQSQLLYVNPFTKNRNSTKNQTKGECDNFYKLDANIDSEESQLLDVSVFNTMGYTSKHDDICTDQDLPETECGSERTSENSAKVEQLKCVFPDNSIQEIWDALKEANDNVEVAAARLLT